MNALKNFKPATPFKIALLLIVFGIVLNFAAEYYANSSLARYTESHNQIIGAIEFEERLDKLKNDITLTQSKLRGYILTGDSSFIPGVSQEIDLIQDSFEEIEAMAKTDAALMPLVDSLEILILQKTQFDHHTLETYRLSGKKAAENLVKRKIDVQIRDEIYRLIDKLSVAKGGADANTIRNVNNSMAKELDNALAVDELIPFVISGFFIVLGIYLSIIFTKNKQMLAELEQIRQKGIVAGIAKDQFIANISHELRTPLNSVVGYTDLLRNTRLDESQKKYLMAIQLSSETLLQIIGNVLDTSRLDSGIYKIEPVAFSLHKVLQSIELSYQLQFQKKKIQFSIHIESDLPDQLWGDAIKLKQILINLIGNAYKFTEQGTVMVKALSVLSSRQAPIIEFIVQDTGVGIHPIDINNIFDRFYQADTKLSHKYEGSGLGLTITKQLVAVLKGTMHVESEPGVGSAFKVQIPFQLAVQNAELPVEAFADFSISTHERLNVLVVDDNEMNLALVSHILENWKYRVVAAKNGNEAIAHLKTETFDLILMDVQMPDLDGFAVTRQIRLELNLSTPIIALTAHSGQSNIEKCKQAGMDEFISKPFKEIDLYRVISKIRSGRKPVLNSMDHLKGVSKGDHQFEQKVINYLLSNLPTQTNELKKAVQEANHTLARSIIHGMRNNLGIFDLKDELEKQFVKINVNKEETKSTVEALASVEAIEKICERVLSTLKPYKIDI